MLALLTLSSSFLHGLRKSHNFFKLLACIKLEPLVDEIRILGNA
jgi:hypothetical protein